MEETALVESRVIQLTSETDGLLSFSKEINQKSYDAFMDAYEQCNVTDNITFIINSCGGMQMFVLLIANTLVMHEGKVTAQVPRYAMSGATVLALVCDEIELAPAACLGPIDAQLILPLKSMLPALSKWKDTNAFCDVAHHLLSDMAPDYLDQLKELLLYKYTEEQVQRLILLFHDKYHHATPIFYRQLQSLEFLNVKVVHGLKLPRKQGAGSSADKLKTMFGL